MHHTMFDEKTWTMLMYIGVALCIIAPIIPLTIKFLYGKHEEEKERKMILRQVMEDREAERRKEREAASMMQSSLDKKISGEDLPFKLPPKKPMAKVKK